MSDSARAGRFSGARIEDRQIHELIGIARGMLADGRLCDAEIGFLHRWLVASDGEVANPLVSQLVQRLNSALADGMIDDDERSDLQSTMMALTANDFELGETLKSTTLPLCNPAPVIDFLVRECASLAHSHSERVGPVKLRHPRSGQCADH